MPLTEISSNVRRSSSTSGGKPPSEARSEPVPSLPPAAIQSMLRTTTELGDIGQFAARRPRMPRSGSRMLSNRPRSGSFDASFTASRRHQRSSQIGHTGRHRGPRSAASASGLSTGHRSRSNMSSHGHGVRSKKYPSGLHPYSGQGMLNPRPIPHGLYTHRSLVTLRSNMDTNSSHSTSPMMHPRQMRRPTHKAPSPAYSEMQVSTGTPRPGVRRAPSAGTVASSPASMFRRGPGALGYRSDFNASYGSLTRLPSPAVSFIRNGPNGTPGPLLRTPTPMSASFQRARSILSNGAVSLPGISRSPTGSTIPAYYDYSESFMEEDCFSPAGDQQTDVPPLTMDQTILKGLPTPPRRDAQSPFGMREGSTFHPSELPTKHNRRPSEQSKHSKHSKQSKHSFSGVIPKRVSSLATPVMGKSSPSQAVTRRTRSADSGLSDVAKTEPYARRASITSRRSNTPSSTSIFFPNAARSSRDLTTLAARVHSPPLDVQRRAGLSETMTPQKCPANADPACVANFEGRNIPNWQLPTFSFRPISFARYSSTLSSRPKTSEATPSRKPMDILSPMPERPMSSQSRKRFSKILEIEDNYDGTGIKPFTKHSIRPRPMVLHKVDESPASLHNMLADRRARSVSLVSDDLLSPSRPNQEGVPDSDQRTSPGTSHDVSSIGSLLDKHIECLGLGPEIDSGSEESTSLQNRKLDEQSSAEDTIRLTHILATAPSWPKGRPWTSGSQQPSSLGLSGRQRLRPHRLFASMDGGSPMTIIDGSQRACPTDSTSKTSWLPYGWQTLPSSSQLLVAATDDVPSVLSGYLGDVDSSQQQVKLKIKRHSNLSSSVSMSSHLSELSARLSKESRDASPHGRSKSEVVARQASHRRRRMRIMLKLKSRSPTLGCMLDEDVRGHKEESPTTMQNGSPKRSNIKSSVAGCAELSADSLLPSVSTFGPSMPKIPSIPARRSSIIAMMPEPVRRSMEVVRQASKRSNQSRQSNASIVELVGKPQKKYHLPRLGSIPKLTPPEFGPSLTASDLNLSLPYADIPSTIRPTLRETKSFFSDDSSAQRQRRSLRQKFTLHSLRHALPGSGGSSSVGREILRNGDSGVKLSHSCQMKGRKSLDGQSAAADEDVVPMSDFAYRKRKVIERIKGWWRRQCVPRRLALKKRRNGLTVPGSTGW